MRVYVSATFEDLIEHRAAAIQILRQLGHEVVAMEDYVAEDAVPLAKVLEDVAMCDVFVAIIAWRYGYVPKQAPALAGARPGKTSITEYEYRKAVEAGKPVLAFLLDERAPWPAHLIDGVRDARKGKAIREFRSELQRERLVAYFTTADRLASRVSAAVATVRMREELQKQLLAPLSSDVLGFFTTPDYLSDSYTMPIVDLVANSPQPLVAAIDLSTAWWSTRLYLLAAVGQQLGQLQRIIILDDGRFVGMLSATAARLALQRIHRHAAAFEKRVLSNTPGPDVRETASRYLEEDWNRILGASPGDPGPEMAVQHPVNPANLRQWFGDSLLTIPVRVSDVDGITPVDLLRILDYPNDFVPVASSSEAGSETVQVVNKRELTDRLARNTLIEILDRLGVR